MFGKKEDKDLIANISRLAEIVSRNIEAIERLEKRLDRLEVFASVGKIEPKVKKEGELTSVISGFDSSEDFDKLVGIIEKINETDKSFECGNDKEKKEIYLYSKSKDELHKKSLWFISKTGIENLKYNVE